MPTGIEPIIVNRYFPFLPLLCSALIFAHRAFADRDILARTAADIVLLALAGDADSGNLVYGRTTAAMLVLLP